MTAARSDRTTLPGPAVGPLRRTIRYWIARLAAAALTRAYLRVRLEGRATCRPARRSTASTT